MVNPGLEHSGHVEVIHGGGDNDFIGGEQLIDELVGELEGGLVVPRVLLGSGEGAGYPGQINVGNLGGGQISGDDLATDMVGLPLGRESVAEFARDGMLTARAHIDL